MLEYFFENRCANGDRAHPATVHQRYPEIVVELLIEAGITNIVVRRFDAGIRLGESPEKGVVARWSKRGDQGGER